MRGWHPSPSQYSIYEHISITGIHLPKSTLPGFVLASGDFHEAFIQGEVVADRILKWKIDGYIQESELERHVYSLLYGGWMG